MIYHYVEVHHFKPSDNFLKAVWDGPLPPSPEYYAKLESLGFRWSTPPTWYPEGSPVPEVLSLLMGGTSLARLGINNSGYARGEALDIIDRFEKLGVTILGGDAYEVDHGILKIAGQGWNCGHLRGESEGEHFRRSINEARNSVLNVSPEKSNCLISFSPHLGADTPKKMRPGPRLDHDVCSLLMVGTWLGRIQLRTWGLTQRQATITLNSLKDMGVAVLQIRVVQVSGNKLSPTDGTWTCTRAPSDTEQEFVMRSVEAALRYVSQFDPKDDGKLFALFPDFSVPLLEGPSSTSKYKP